MKQKHPKMDRLLISNEPWEIRVVAEKFGITRKQVRAALAAVGSKSRRKVYKYIREKLLSQEVYN